MSNEKITQILDSYQKYLNKVKKTFVSDERITQLLSKITEELNQLHIERCLVHNEIGQSCKINSSLLQQ